MRGAVTRPYYALSDFLKGRFGCKVFKVSLDAGLTCPNRDGRKGVGGCVYCESGSYEPKDYKKDADIKTQLAEGIERVRKRHKAERFIAYFQMNTNTYAPLDRLESQFKEAASFPEVVGLAISTRPDCLGDGVLGLLSSIKKEKHLWVELGLQSANDSTLERINRGHTVEDFTDAFRRAKARDIDVCAHIILGLPGENRADALKTVEYLSALGVWGVKFHQLQVIKGTALEEGYRRNDVALLGLEEYSGLVVECLEVMPPSTVIHRLCADAPKRMLVAPSWGANKFMIADSITKIMSRRGSFQGARHR